MTLRRQAPLKVDHAVEIDSVIENLHAVMTFTADQIEGANLTIPFLFFYYCIQETRIT